MRKYEEIGDRKKVEVEQFVVSSRRF